MRPLVRQFVLGVVFGLAVFALLYAMDTDKMGLEAYIAEIRQTWLEPNDPRNVLGYVIAFFAVCSSFGFAYVEWGPAEAKMRAKKRKENSL